MSVFECVADRGSFSNSDGARGPSTPSFDYLVGGCKERWRDVETQ
jgi:hypothetical protein